MSRFYLILCLSFFYSIGFSQEVDIKLDSLNQLLDKANSQKEELKLLSEIIAYSIYSDSTTFNKYINTFQSLAEELKDTLELANAYEQRGRFKLDKNKLVTAVDHFQKSGKLYKLIGSAQEYEVKEVEGYSLALKGKSKRALTIFKNILSREKSTEGTSGEKGTGLGLHVVKDLVEKCEGKIDVESVFGSGTTFKISLPIARYLYFKTLDMYSLLHLYILKN